MSNFTKDEQYTSDDALEYLQISLNVWWKFPDNDAFTNALITNTRVLEVLKKSTNNRPLFTKEESAAWVADAPQKEKSSWRYLTKPTRKWQ
jgi:hypothetical protein